MSLIDFTKIAENNQYGRFLLASQTFQTGDLILQDTPFAFGPKSGTQPVCLGCYKFVTCEIVCPKCSWPICDPFCPSLSNHQPECEIFSTSGTKFHKSQTSLQYECLTPLRVLLAKEENPTRWHQEVAQLEAHNDLRKEDPIWHFNQINIVNFLRGPCKLDRIPEELLHTICGILEVNAFEAPTLGGGQIRCLYPKLSLLSHNCVPNIFHAINPQSFEVEVRAAVPVAQNGLLFCNYSSPLWPTLIRRDFLKQSKFFECQCERCSDRTELGSNMGTLKCHKCESGFLLSSAPLSFDCEWVCTKCNFSTDASTVKKLYDLVQKELDLFEKLQGPCGIYYKEMLFESFKEVFHERNSYNLILKMSLNQLYPERKIEFYNDVLEMLEIVEPGLSRFKAITFYELHFALLQKAKHNYQAGKLNKIEFLSEMEKAASVLEKALSIFKFEFPNSKEGLLGLEARASFEKVQHEIATFLK